MTKQECLSKLDSIIESTCSQAIYITACNYYDTVSDLTEEEFDTVADWYEVHTKKFLKPQVVQVRLYKNNGKVI